MNQTCREITAPLSSHWTDEDGPLTSCGRREHHLRALSTRWTGLGPFPFWEGPGSGKAGAWRRSHGTCRSGKGLVKWICYSYTSTFLRKRKGTNATSRRVSPAAVGHSLPPLSQSLFTFLLCQGPAQPLDSFCCSHRTAINYHPYQKSALAELKASSAQAETSTPVSQISVAPPPVLFKEHWTESDVLPGFQAALGLTQSSVFCTSATSLEVLQTYRKVRGERNKLSKTIILIWKVKS